MPSHLFAVTAVLVTFGAVIGAAFQVPWTGAAVGLSLAVGIVILLGD